MPLWVWPVILGVIVYPIVIFSWFIISYFLFNKQMDYISTLANIFGIGTLGMVIGFILYLMLEWRRSSSD